MFSDDLISRVRDSVNIVDLVSGYVSLKKTGKNHTGLCPFHAEKTPSFSVNPDKQIFHCFGFDVCALLHRPFCKGKLATIC